MKIVITGGTGFVGRNLVKALLWEGYDVVVLSRQIDSSFYEADCPVIMVDYSDSAGLRNQLVNIDPNFIIHLGASRDRSSLEQVEVTALWRDVDSDINLILGSVNLKNLNLFIYFGTADMYTCEPGKKIGLDNPIAPRNPYGLKKAIGKNLIESLYETNGFPGVCLVPSVIYGPGQAPDMFLPALIESMRRNEKFNMTEGSQFRDYIFVTDVVDAVVNLIVDKNKTRLGLTVLLGSDFSISIRELALLVSESFGKDCRHLLNFGAVKSQDSEDAGYSFDMSSSQHLLNWKAKVPLEMGIKLTLDHAGSYTDD